jgi:hypothetical protein
MAASVRGLQGGRHERLHRGRRIGRIEHVNGLERRAGAGLRAGDVIVRIGDVRVEDAAGSSRT